MFVKFVLQSGRPIYVHIGEAQLRFEGNGEPTLMLHGRDLALNREFMTEARWRKMLLEYDHLADTQTTGDVMVTSSSGAVATMKDTALSKPDGAVAYKEGAAENPGDRLMALARASIGRSE